MKAEEVEKLLKEKLQVHKTHICYENFKDLVTVYFQAFVNGPWYQIEISGEALAAMNPEGQKDQHRIFYEASKRIPAAGVYPPEALLEQRVRALFNLTGGFEPDVREEIMRLWELEKKALGYSGDGFAVRDWQELESAYVRAIRQGVSNSRVIHDARTAKQVFDEELGRRRRGHVCATSPQFEIPDEVKARLRKRMENAQLYVAPLGISEELTFKTGSGEVKILVGKSNSEKVPEPAPAPAAKLTPSGREWAPWILPWPEPEDWNA